MKTIFKQIISIILSLCLVAASMPPLRSENYLAPPGGITRASLFPDDISRDVAKLHIDRKLNKCNNIKPIIEKIIRDYIDPATREGKKILSELQNVRFVRPVVVKKNRIRYFSARISIFFGLSILSIAQIYFIPHPFKSIIILYTCPLLIFFGIRIYTSIKYLWPFIKTKNRFKCAIIKINDYFMIDLQDSWNESDVAHEFGHFIADVLDLDDVTHIFGSLMEYLYTTTPTRSIFHNNPEATSNLITLLQDEGVYNPETTDPISIENLLIKELQFSESKKNGNEHTDDYDTGMHIGNAIDLMLAFNSSINNKEAFMFIIYKLRELKIRRITEKISFDKLYEKDKRIDNLNIIKILLYQALSSTIDTETSYGREILRHIKYIKIFSSSERLKSETKKRNTVYIISLISFAVIEYLLYIIHPYVFCSTIILALIGLVIFLVLRFKHFGIFKDLDKFHEVVGEIISGALSIGKKDKNNYFPEIFSFLVSNKDIENQAIKDGISYLKQSDKKTIVDTKTDLINLLRNNNLSHEYKTAYVFSVIRNLPPNDKKLEVNFLISLFRDMPVENNKKSIFRISQLRKTQLDINKST